MALPSSADRLVLILILLPSIRSHSGFRPQPTIGGAGIAIVIAVLYFSLFPLPSGWELVAPVAGVTTILVMTVVGLALERRDGDDKTTVVESET